MNGSAKPVMPAKRLSTPIAANNTCGAATSCRRPTQANLMRKFLDGLYVGSGVLAALFMILIVSVILTKIVGRMFGFLVPSASEIAGFSVAASAFLALAPTLQHGAHIRVT